MRFLALDFETAGLDPRRHGVVSLGLARFDGSLLDSREWLLRPPVDRRGRVAREYDVAAMEISRATWPQLKREGLPAKGLIRAVRDFVGEDAGLPVVAFNASFDYGFWSELLHLAGEGRRPPLQGPWHCARTLAQCHLDLPRYDLDSVCGALGLSRFSAAHGAAEDAVLAGRVFARLSG